MLRPVDAEEGRGGFVVVGGVGRANESSEFVNVATKRNICGLPNQMERIS